MSDRALKKSNIAKPVRVVKAMSLREQIYENLRERILELTKGRGAEVVCEAVGKPSLVAEALTIVKPTGVLQLVGVERRVAGDRLRDQRGEEQQQEGDRQAVHADRLHQPSRAHE